jgi:hypothetical protein
MKHVQITLDQSRADKLEAIANQAIHEVQQLTLPNCNRAIYVSAHRVSASAIAKALLEDSIDEIYREISQ